MSDFVSDKDQIKEAVESVHRYRDHAMWDKITDYFVDKPFVDDAELTKEQPGFKSIKEIISNWKHELKSYFYATRHKIQSLKISVKGSRQAEVESPILGQYFLSDRGNRYVLTVNGTYRYELVKKSGHWKIGKVEFKLNDQNLKQIGI